MSKLEELIQQYCPDGVEYLSIGSLITRIRTKGVKYPSIKTVYSVSNTLGLVKAEEFRENVIYSEDTSNYIVVDKGMFAYNPARLNIGSLAWLQTNEPGLVSPMYVVFSIDKSKIIPEFLYLHLKTPYVNSKINSLTESGARFRFDFERWGLIEIPVPPLPVQEEIVRILDTFTELQAELQAELQKRKQQYNYYRDNLLSFEGRTDVEWKKLGEVCTVLRGRRLTKSQLSEDGRYKVFHGGIDPIGYYDEYNREGNTTMVINVGASAGTLGFSKDKFWSSDGCFCLSQTPFFSGKYVFYYLQTREPYLMSRVRRAGIPTLDGKVLEEMSFPVPALAEQQKIVDILERFDALTNDLTAGLPAEIEKRRQQYEYYRDKLLTFKRK